MQHLWVTQPHTQAGSAVTEKQIYGFLRDNLFAQIRDDDLQRDLTAFSFMTLTAADIFYPDVSGYTN